MATGRAGPGKEMKARGNGGQDAKCNGSAKASCNGKVHTSPLGTLLHLSLVFFCIFLAYIGAETLQSSLYAADGLGLVSIGSLYCTYFLSALFAAPSLVRRLPPKWALFISWFFYMAFIASNLCPGWWTLVLTAAVTGFWCGIAWVSCGVYICSLALEESERTGKDRSVVLSRYNGIFFFIFSSSHIVGNVMSGVILSGDRLFSEPKANITYRTTNHTYSYSPQNISERTRRLVGSGRNPDVCGANYCAYKASHVAQIIQPDQKLVNILTIAFLAIMAVGLVATAFLRKLKPDTESANKGCTDVFMAFRLMKDVRLLLLLPALSLFGAFKGVAIGGFTQAFISCSLGVKWVGYVMLVRGISFSCGSLMSGVLAKCVHRAVLFTVALLLLAAAALTWLFWVPSPDQKVIFFLLVTLEGLGSSAVRVLTGAFMGFLFPDDKEAAFAHYSLWTALASAVFYISGKFLCFGAQVYIALTLVCLATLGYFGVELMLLKGKPQFTKVPLTDPKSVNDEKTIKC